LLVLLLVLLYRANTKPIAKQVDVNTQYITMISCYILAGLHWSTLKIHRPDNSRDIGTGFPTLSSISNR